MDKNRCYFCNKKLDVVYPIYFFSPATRLYSAICLCKECDEEYWSGKMFDMRIRLRKLVYGEV